MQTYKDLIVWQKAVELSVKIYEFTESFPQDERFGLVSQMRRSAVSIPSNIAEGRSRSTRNDFKQFLHIAYGSATELETQLIIAKKLSFGSKVQYNEVDALLLEVLKMLRVMISKLKS
ncbi:diversity-generating retroelement protein bAvd family protein [Candidatus Kaiserbacteria bacterium CG10_big_fil_rev_8_21_14_0_10_49_17]|uniref:Diversity-generating retroelement protein bAvd family protein n=1 Tax=Candidatus Kaiserbacteria bacterium CG10_big_fil_rev_8_21_14_0_10_49_17 TaxID=1974609 RepID=A0A2M6WDP5_9BACT|nr:MAG: diversity-generating retroelement protein bAvd family protein [Candidatus Kaiserbacteria bacterium CG10_big_fil_rev_8_21_14_0_10_49_17]